MQSQQRPPPSLQGILTLGRSSWDEGAMTLYSTYPGHWIKLPLRSGCGLKQGNDLYLGQPKNAKSAAYRESSVVSLL